MELRRGDDIITRYHDTRDTGKLETRGLTRAVMTISALAHLQQARIKTSHSYFSRFVARTSYYVAGLCGLSPNPNNENVLINFAKRVV